MKKTNLFAILTLAATPAFLHAQITSYSDIVGYQSSSLPVGSTAIGFPLLNPDVLKSAASTLTSNSLGISGESNVGAKLVAGEPYYLEVYSGTLKGDRFDIDTAATISAGNNSVVLNSTSANNSFPVASLTNQLNGATVAIRQHITLEKIQSYFSAALTGNNTASSADQIQLYNPSNSSFSSYYLRSNGTEWRLVGSPTVANKVPVPPGSGVFIRKANSSGQLTATGSVRNNDFSRPFVVGSQLIANPYPIAYSPAGLGGTAANGWSGNNTASSADQIQIFDPITSSYSSYYLRSNGTEWRLVGSPTAVTGTSIIADNAGYFVKRAVADSDNYLLNPIANP